MLITTNVMPAGNLRGFQRLLTSGRKKVFFFFDYFQNWRVKCTVRNGKIMAYPTEAHLYYP